MLGRCTHISTGIIIMPATTNSTICFTIIISGIGISTTNEGTIERIIAASLEIPQINIKAADKAANILNNLKSATYRV